MKKRDTSAQKSGQTGRIIIQLSELCGAELTRTGADFLLPILPSATSPCRGSTHTPFHRNRKKRKTRSQEDREEGGRKGGLTARVSTSEWLIKTSFSPHLNMCYSLLETSTVDSVNCVISNVEQKQNPFLLIKVAFLHPPPHNQRPQSV